MCVPSLLPLTGSLCISSGEAAGAVQRGRPRPRPAGGAATPGAHSTALQFARNVPTLLSTAGRGGYERVL
jgi:hypothetical protein